MVQGVGAGTQPADVKTTAQTVKRARVRILYPDIVLITLTDVLGNEQQTFIDGYYLAAAFDGVLSSTDVDAATPWTNRRLVGFDQLGRTLDEVTKNQIAVTGVTIIDRF